MADSEPRDAGRSEHFLRVVWRRRWIVLFVLIAVPAVAGAVSAVLPKTYQATSRLIVVLPDNQQSYEGVQASEAIARAYASLVSSKSIAKEVAAQLRGGATADSVSSATSVAPVIDTQLIAITSDDSRPARAQRIANAYAAAFIRHSRDRLQRITAARVALADSASLPSSPIRPKPALYVAVAALIGILLALGLALLLERLEAAPRTAEDVEREFGLPVLARIPRRGRSGGSQRAFIEASRSLRSVLQLITDEGSRGRAPGARAIAITSSRGKEGKSTIVEAVALAAASAGSSVLIVETGRRSKQLAKYASREPVTGHYPTMGDLLSARATVSQVARATGVPNLSFIPADVGVDSLWQALGTEEARWAFGRICSAADLVLIDCRPIFAGADVAAIARLVDGVVVVLDARTKDDDLRSALREVRNVSANIMGIVLNSQSPSYQA